MSTKELAMETIRELPEDASWQEIEERIHFLSAIDKARGEVLRGETVPHQDVRNLLNGWLTEYLVEIGTRRSTRSRPLHRP